MIRWRNTHFGLLGATKVRFPRNPVIAACQPMSALEAALIEGSLLVVEGSVLICSPRTNQK